MVLLPFAPRCNLLWSVSELDPFFITSLFNVFSSSKALVVFHMGVLMTYSHLNYWLSWSSLVFVDQPQWSTRNLSSANVSNSVIIIIIIIIIVIVLFIYVIRTLLVKALSSLWTCTAAKGPAAPNFLQASNQSLFVHFVELDHEDDCDDGPSLLLTNN